MSIIIPTTLMSSAALNATLIGEIYAVTNKPHLVELTQTALRKSTMKYHMVDLWKNDLVTKLIALPALAVTDDIRYGLDLTDAVSYPLYRRVSTIKEYNSPLTGQEVSFKELDVDNILDDYQLERVNYWYQAGQQVSLRSNKALTNVAVTYWQYPNIIPATYSSWIATQYPDIIISEAVAYVFKIIGKVEEANALQREFIDNVAQLRITQI